MIIISAIVGQTTHLVVEQPLLLFPNSRRPVSTLPTSG
jgi:hypothetical protein